MNIRAIIHEQVEWDGTIKSFQLKANDDIGELWVAFPGDYQDPLNGPFYFLDREYETKFYDKRANCRVATIAPENFYQDYPYYVFKTAWHRVPTTRGELTYYVIYLPEFAVMTEIHATDPYSNSKEYSRAVFRDDDKKRFAIYIECSSRYGVFSFDLTLKFCHDEANFKNASYWDEHVVEFYQYLDSFYWVSDDQTRENVTNLFVQTKHYNQHMGDTYNVNQAGAVGPGASATNNTFNQQLNSLPADTDYEKLEQEMAVLKNHLATNAKTPEHWGAVTAVANAEEAAKEKNGNKILTALSSTGKWVFDIAKEIGVSIAAEVIKKSIGA